MSSKPQHGQHLLYCREYLPEAARINKELLIQYQDISISGHSSLHRSHFFSGRYENIYIERSQVPAIEEVLAVASEGARRFLKQPEVSLQVGFWFNDMEPGHVTLPHKHDEDDELLSAVYYIQVPLASGDLVLAQGVDAQVLVPAEGEFIFFAPNILHEVTRNSSSQRRLSVGMNFGSTDRGYNK